MNICDFSSVISTVKRYIIEDCLPNQIDLMYELFATFMEDELSEDFDFDNGSVCRWIKGQLRVSPRICSYYRTNRAKNNLTLDIKNGVLPLLYDSSMLTQELHDLIVQDTTISEKQKKKLLSEYPCKTEKKEASFIAQILCFVLDRPFIKRDTMTKQLIQSTNLSPQLTDHIMYDDFINPCEWFRGREDELQRLHDLLITQSKVFISGIAGIGKSEFAKAYAKTHKSDYSNVLFISYTGSLINDITNLDFVDDFKEDTSEEKFKKHHRFLRSLKEDTLIIIDNFNSTVSQEEFLNVMLKYRCKIIFTTRCNFENCTTLVLEEIKDINVLFDLISKFYSSARRYREIIEKIINTVHSHTLAVELVGRLLENGLFEPEEILEKLQREKANLSSQDEIGIKKDGNFYKQTYYGHIHTLFSLYELPDYLKNIMCNMTLIENEGISARRFAHWLNLNSMNAINELIEIGLIKAKQTRLISLHSMIKEIALVDVKPSIQKCQTLCVSIQELCVMHGIEINYNKEVFSTVSNIVDFADKDDLELYLRVLKDVFQYAEKYNEEKLMKLIIFEIENILKDSSFATDINKAILLDCKSTVQTSKNKSIELMKQALKLVPTIDNDSALFVSNLNANIGGLYYVQKKNKLAKQHLDKAHEIFLDYNLPINHDYLVQALNYALLNTELGYVDKAIADLKTLLVVIGKEISMFCEDYANVCLALDVAYRKNNDFISALEYYNKGMSILNGVYIG